MTAEAGSGHPGGSLSAVEILTSLFFSVLRYNPQEPKWPDRDRFVISKGHATPVFYSILAHAGYFPHAELATYRKLGSRLQGHPDMRRLPGVEASTGSLGQGLSIGVGMALAGRLDKKDYRTYVLQSDGESEEGQVWEAAMFAGFHKLDKLTVIVDYNKFQLDGPVAKILDLEPFKDKWRSFGWATEETDGHDLTALLEKLDWAQKTKGKPTCIIAHTVKGKGVSFMENNNHFHGVAPTPEEAERALKELEEKNPKLKGVRS